MFRKVRFVRVLQGELTNMSQPEGNRADVAVVRQTTVSSPASPPDVRGLRPSCDGAHGNGDGDGDGWPGGGGQHGRKEPNAPVSASAPPTWSPR